MTTKKPVNKIKMTWRERNLAFQAINTAPLTARPGMPFDESDALRPIYTTLLGGMQSDENGDYPFNKLGDSLIEINDKEKGLLIKYINLTQWQTLEMKFMMEDFVKRIK